MSEAEDGPRDSAGASRLCPRCDSDHIRRGGNRTWLIFIALIAMAVAAVVVVHLQALLVAAALVVLIVITHLVLGEWTCQDCGAQW
jgi:Flp pilus assembly protein TadB